MICQLKLFVLLRLILVKRGGASINPIQTKAIFNFKFASLGSAVLF